MPLLTVVIIEYHCADQIDDCLDSLSKHMIGIDWECLIVSNSLYSATELQGLCGRFKGATILDAKANLGYAGGVNYAIQHSNAPYLFVMNPDCRLTDDNLQSLCALFDKHEDVAVIGPKVIDVADQVQPSCRRTPRPWTFLLVRSVFRHLPGASREKRRYLMEDFDRNSQRDVDWVSGGAMLVRRKAADEVGGMDERYFLYMEDADWCRRMWQSGWRVIYSPLSTVCHSGQHASLRGGLGALLSPHTRYHLISMVKYFLKYGFSR